MKTTERNTLVFGRGSGNDKLKKLEERTGKKVLTLSLSAGHACPFAVDCKACVKIREDGSLHVVDGDRQAYRCYAASMEARRPVIYESRRRNLELARAAARRGPSAVRRLILQSLPKKVAKAGGADCIVRAHVAGDYFNITYLRGWCMAAGSPELAQAVVYGHTKSLPLLQRILTAEGPAQVRPPTNMRFVLSRQEYGTWSSAMADMELAGEVRDLLAKIGVRCVETFVLDDVKEAAAQGLPVDEDDFLAYECKEDFALIVHGTQPKGKGKRQ